MVQAKQVVKKKVERTIEEGGVIIFKFPEYINIVSQGKMITPIRIPKSKVLEVDATDTEVIKFIRAIEGVEDITDAVLSYRK